MSRTLRSLAFVPALTLLTALACFQPAAAQTTDTTTGNQVGFGAFGRSLGQTGQVMSATDFGGAGAGNLLRGALNPNSALGAGMGMGMNGMGIGGMGMGGMGMGGMGGFGRMGMGGMNGMQNMNGQNGQNAGRKPLKIQAKLGFTLPATAYTARAAQFETRLKRLPGLASGKNITVTMDGRTAILEGRVTSAHERDLAQRLAMLEPGIASVRNLLEVEPSMESSSPEVLPTPTR